MCVLGGCKKNITLQEKFKVIFLFSLCKYSGYAVNLFSRDIEAFHFISGILRMTGNQNKFIPRIEIYIPSEIEEPHERKIQSNTE